MRNINLITVQIFNPIKFYRFGYWKCSSNNGIYDMRVKLICSLRKCVVMHRSQKHIRDFVWNARKTLNKLFTLLVRCFIQWHEQYAIPSKVFFSFFIVEFLRSLCVFFSIISFVCFSPMILVCPVYICIWEVWKHEKEKHTHQMRSEAKCDEGIQTN